MSSDNGKTILVVDDEPEIRKLVGAMVGSLGYKVLTADSGEHALTLYKHHGPFELLITDVVAPGMSGPMLADKLTALQAGLKVLFISGYDNTDRKSTRLNSSHLGISYAVFCLKKRTT